MGKSQHKCSPTFQSWESELSTQEIAAFNKIENNKRILARRISPHTQNLLQGCFWWLADAPTRLFGFSMMLSGESPSMLFDLVLTRFEADYNPHLIYDASCLAKEYGYNRELRRFMSLTITTDRFHECNHTSCSAAFKSSEYSSLENINSEACEQTNFALRIMCSSFPRPSQKTHIFLVYWNLTDNMFRLVALITYANLLINDHKSKLWTYKLKKTHFHFHKCNGLKTTTPQGLMPLSLTPSMSPTPLPPHDSSSPPIPRAPPCRVNPPQLHLGYLPPGYMQFSEERTLTHYILVSVTFWLKLTSPICLKMPKCPICSHF